MLNIGYLAQYPQHTPTVARWIYDEFFGGGLRPGKTVEDLQAAFETAGEDVLPVRLVALEGGQCVGTASLVALDHSHSSLTPWLAAVYVEPGRRGTGVGEALVAAVADKARRLGHGALYLRTELAGGYYRRLGWQYVETLRDDYGLEPEIYRLDLV